MSMKKQPEGVIRTARVAGEKPPQSYDLWLRTDDGDNDGKAYLGWSERLPRGMWQAHPADGSDPATIPPFKEHTALVELLLSIYRGLENTSEGGSAQEHGSVEETAAITEAQREEAQISEDAISDEYGPSIVPDKVTKEQGDGGHKPAEELEALADVPPGGEAEFRAAVKAKLEETDEPERTQHGALGDFLPEHRLEELAGALPVDGEAAPRPQNVVAGQVVDVPFRAPAAEQSSQESPAPEAGAPHDPGQVLFRPPASAGDDPGGTSPREAGPPASPAAPSDFWGTVGGSPPPPEENMS